MFAETQLGQVFCDLVYGLWFCPFSKAIFPSLICSFQTNQPGKGGFRTLPVIIPQQFQTVPCRSHRAFAYLLPMDAKSDIYFFNLLLPALTSISIFYFK